MIPTHILDDLRNGHVVAVLARGDEVDFLVHEAGDSPDDVKDYAECEGSELLASHLKDRRSLLRFVAAHVAELGGEG